MKRCISPFLLSIIFFSVVCDTQTSQVSAQDRPTNEEITTICQNFIITVVKNDSFYAQALLGYYTFSKIVDIKFQNFEIVKIGNYQQKPGKAYWPVRTHYTGSFKSVASMPFAGQSKQSEQPFERTLNFMVFKDDFGEWKADKLSE